MLAAIVLVVSIEMDFEEKTSPTFIGLGGVIPLMDILPEIKQGPANIS